MSKSGVSYVCSGTGCNDCPLNTKFPCLGSCIEEILQKINKEVVDKKKNNC